jgi:RalA-binding protein 1
LNRFSTTILARSRFMAGNPTSNRPPAPTSTTSSRPPLYASQANTNTPSAPLSVDGILQQFSSSGSPYHSALEYVVAERNNLVAQNSQLWKLMEKQRSAYSQALKELERIRGERDAYRTRVQSLNTRTVGVKPHVSSSSVGDPPSFAPIGDSDASLPPPLTQDISDDIQTPRSSQQYPQSNRVQTSRVITGQNHQDIEYASNSPLIPVSSLNTPPRIESLTLSGVSTSSTPRRTPFISNFEVPKLDRAIHPDTELLPQYRPENHTSSLPPQAFPSLDFPRSTFKSTELPHADEGSASSLDSRLPLGTVPLVPSTELSYKSENDGGHIANMSNHSPASTPLSGGDPAFGLEPSEHLKAHSFATPMDQQSVSSCSLGSGISRFEGNSDREFGHHSESYADVETEEEFVDQDDHSSIQQGSFSSHLKGETIADEFPLPPSRMTHPRSTQESPGTSPLQSSEILPPKRADSTSSQLSSSSSHHHEVANGAKVDRAELERPFQALKTHALPLLSSDLSRCSIRVVNSYVRPNDRGKDVLSFSVIVSPKNNQEPWRIEKRHSDVLALDHAVRSRVERNVAKKISSLPDTKLWKDHAPAKVDLRKVHFSPYAMILLLTLVSLP